LEAVKKFDSSWGLSGGDGKTGDGAGILIKIPRKFFFKIFRKK